MHGKESERPGLHVNEHAAMHRDNEGKGAFMVVDFQRHYIPVELAKKRGLYSETGKTLL